MKKCYYTLEQLNQYSAHTMVDYIGIEFTQIGDAFLKAEMPVDERTIQPNKILHGGANLVLAETLGGALSVLVLDPKRFEVRGMDINANHVRSVEMGKKVIATASFLHQGMRSHVVEIKIENEKGQLVSIARLTNYIHHL